MRVRIKCCNSSRIKGCVEVFFNNVGYELNFLAEGIHQHGADRGGDSGVDKLDDKDSNRDRDILGEERDEEKRGKIRRERKGNYKRIDL